MKLANKVLSNQSGMGMVDLVVALALLALALSSAGALATTSSRTGSEAGRRTQATALASQDLELLRTLRDATLRGGAGTQVAWDGLWGPGAVVGTCAYYAIVPGANPTLSPTGATPIAFAVPNASFSRTMQVCNDTDYSYKFNGGGVLKTKVVASNRVKNVTLVVTWPESNGTRTLTFKTILGLWQW